MKAPATTGIYTLHIVGSVRGVEETGSGLNLYTFTRYQGVDPEVNFNGLTPGIDYVSGYPTTRTFTFGVKLGF